MVLGPFKNLEAKVLVKALAARAPGKDTVVTSVAAVEVSPFMHSYVSSGMMVTAPMVIDARSGIFVGLVPRMVSWANSIRPPLMTTPSEAGSSSSSPNTRSLLFFSLWQ